MFHVDFVIHVGHFLISQYTVHLFQYPFQFRVFLQCFLSYDCCAIVGREEVLVIF